MLRWPNRRQTASSETGRIALPAPDGRRGSGEHEKAAVAPRRPRRLTNSTQMPPAASFAVFHQILQRHVTLHWHEFYELAFTIAGEGSHIVNGLRRPLTPGSMFLLTPVDFHEIIPSPGTTLEMFNAILSEKVLEPELYRLLFASPRDYARGVVVTEPHVMAGNYRRLMAEYSSQQSGFELAVRAILECIFVDFVRSWQPETAVTGGAHTSPQQEELHDALVFIHHHFREPVMLKDVAMHVGLSPNYFSECFHRMSGASFQSYLQDLRLRFAMSLLVASDMSVTDVCHSSGFNTIAHFERAFKKKYGKPPGSCRRDTVTAPRPCQ